MDPNRLNGMLLDIAKTYTDENDPAYRQKIKEIVDHAFDANDGYPPVSYTHLDVYKRQSQPYCVPVSAFAFRLGWLFSALSYGAVPYTAFLIALSGRCLLYTSRCV